MCKRTNRSLSHHYGLQHPWILRSKLIVFSPIMLQPEETHAALVGVLAEGVHDELSFPPPFLSRGG